MVHVHFISLEFAFNVTISRQARATLSTNELMDHARSSYYRSRIRHPLAGRLFN